MTAFVALVVRCQRTVCDAELEVELDTLDLFGTTPLGERLAEVDDGWGVDYAGVNQVIHCPDHRD